MNARERAIEAAAKALHLPVHDAMDHASGDEWPCECDEIPDGDDRELARAALDAICSTLSDNEYLGKDGRVMRAERAHEGHCGKYPLAGCVCSGATYRLIPQEGGGE